VDAKNHQGWYGEAFVRVLAAAAGLVTAKPEPDLDGVDFCLWPLRVGARGGARASPINVQVKSGSADTQNADSWGHRLEVAHFNLLADPDIAVFDTFLFLVVVPKDWRMYALADPDRLLLHHAAYWHWLGHESQIVGAKPGAKTTVRVPKAHLLTVDSLRTLVRDPGAAIETVKARAEAS
jgi:hypothetical protein